MNWNNIIKLLDSNLDSELGLRLLLQLDISEIHQFFVKYCISGSSRHWDIRMSTDIGQESCYIHLNNEWLIFSTPAYIRLRKIDLYDGIVSTSIYTLKEYLGTE